MTKEEHLQKQCNLLFNALLELKRGLCATGTAHQAAFLESWSDQMEKAFDKLDVIAITPPSTRGDE